jgi:peptide chain release factor 1
MDELPDITPFQRRLEELGAQMADPAFYQNLRAAAEIIREQQKLQRLVADHGRHRKLMGEISEAKALLRDPNGDSELKELAATELAVLAEQCEQLSKAVLLAMIPPEPTDSRDTVMEIRAGTGGEEASLFAAELFRLGHPAHEQQPVRARRLQGSHLPRHRHRCLPAAEI